MEKSRNSTKHSSVGGKDFKQVNPLSTNGSELCDTISLIWCLKHVLGRWLFHSLLLASTSHAKAQHESFPTAQPEPKQISSAERTTSFVSLTAHLN